MPAGKAAGFIVMDGEDPNAYDPEIGAPLGSTGDPTSHLEVAVKEILEKKRGSNNLAASRPNLLAVNVGLSIDFQTAINLRSWPTLGPADLMPTYDAVLLAACGIDKTIETSAHRVYLAPMEHSSHPFACVSGA
jgi:hypothetical protein